MQKITFENLPSTNTPLNANNLNTLQDNVENAIDSLISNTYGTSQTEGYSQEYINGLSNIEQVNPANYITISSSFTLASGSPKAYKYGNLVFFCYDITGGTINNGQTVLGNCTNKLVETLYGSARIINSSQVAQPASIVAIPSGEFRIYTAMSGARSAGTIVLLVND